MYIQRALQVIADQIGDIEIHFAYSTHNNAPSELRRDHLQEPFYLSIE